MVAFDIDKYVDPLHPEESFAQLRSLLELLCGQEIDTSKLCPEARVAIDKFLERLKPETALRLSCEEFNELLLLFNQYRVQRPFFDFFFADIPVGTETSAEPTEPPSMQFRDLKRGVKKFRGFAMLCFGNYRFAFRRLSEERDRIRFAELLDPWNRDTENQMRAFEHRQDPLTPLQGTKDIIRQSDTWLTGYLSPELLKSDHAVLNALGQAAKDAGETSSREKERLSHAQGKLEQFQKDQEDAIARGKRNTVKYLTWDYLDVYVATSMRQQWEFEETFQVVNKVFTEELADIKKLRWFDPTQSYCENVVDKGLLEGLMLRRAECTIYMAQEGDTLGKDSELAATLAQGKPVIAYVRQITADKLGKFAKDLHDRPLRYFRQRLLTLLADGFFDRPDNRDAVCKLGQSLDLKLESDKLLDEVESVLQLFRDFEKKHPRRFQVIGDEESSFQEEYRDQRERMQKLMAAIESKAADNRADTIKQKHPLGMQVHLETGVANGVLVARTEKECANLVRGVLTRSLKFDIEHLLDKKEKEIATVLVEKETRSRFRVVTKDPCLTNSFWNFYLERKESNRN